MDANPQKAQAAKACFDYNPLINTVFVASNLSCFARKSDAINHARGLDDKEIDVFIRGVDAAVIDADQTADVSDESATMPDARISVVNTGRKKKVDPNAAPADQAVVVDLNAAPADQAAVVDPNAAPAGQAAVVDPNAAPADQAVVVDPNAAPADQAAVVDPNAAPADQAVVVDPNAAPAADNTGIIAELDKAVAEVEHILGLDKNAPIA